VEWVALMSVRERDIHLELWRRLKEATEKKFSLHTIEFLDVKFEPNIDGKPDLVVMASEKGKEIPILVIETKRKVPYRDPRFDPFSKDVIKQAEGYATWLGAPLFATCNGERFVLFETFKEGVPLPQRRVKDYRVPSPVDDNFARMLLEEVVKFRIGVGKWLPLDDVFVQRLRSFHRFITPFIQQALVEKLKEDINFKEEYARWLKSQLFEFSEEMNEKIADQIAYLLMNKIAFYKTLETQVPTLPELKKIEAIDGKEFSWRLGQYFDKVLDVNYEAIFQRTILDEIPLPSKLMQALSDFIEELGTYNLAKIQSDVLGRVYEELIPGDERHRLGQYYTPPPIVELIVEMCVRSPNDTVLDPGCGSGSFLVKAYHKLKDLKNKENPFKEDAELHRELLNQVYGIDINPFPAQLSSINLAVRNLKVRSENINLIVSDFFKVKPAMFPLPKEFDVVVTNPPYTRQEEMEYKQQIRDVALTYPDSSKIDIDARAGIYAYFFTHSAKFLKNGGRMGYITSNTWLDVGFGEGLKKFFLDHLKILAIMEFDAAVFGKALVNTCVPILEKAEDNKERQQNVIKFIRLKKPMDINEVVNVIWTTKQNYEDEQIRIVVKKQDDLQPQERWGTYIRAPTVYFKIVTHPKMTVLRDKAKIRRGITTGSNEFFILDREKVKLWGIEPEFLNPVISSFRGVNRVELAFEDVSEYVLMVREPKGRLEGKSVLKYIEYGENLEIVTKRGTRVVAEVVKGVHNLRTCKGRRIWYDLGKRETAPILFPYLMWERSPFIWNKAKSYAADVFHEIYPYSEKETLCLLGLLNSTPTSLLLELHGRSYGGGVLKTQAYELRILPIPDPNKLENIEKKKIEETFLKLCDVQRRNDKRGEEEARKELDNTVFDALGLTTDERTQVYEGLESLRQMRLKRKAMEILVETPEKWMPPKKPERKRKIVKEEPTKRLDTWIK